MNAFSGILTALETHSGWTITHGLLEQLIDWALLWTPVGVHKRRSPPHSGPLLQFPSWSWIGWTGPVTFNLAFDSTLIPLRSLLEDVEVEEFGKGTTAFRKAKRVILEKSFLRVNVDDDGPRNNFFTFKNANPPDPNKGYSSMSGSTLRFSAMAISASVFEAKDMPPWQWNSAIHSDKRPKGAQNGVLIVSNAGLAGFFLGIDMKFLRQYQWSRLRLVAISTGGGREPGVLEALDYQDYKGKELWLSYQSWSYRFNILTFPH